MRQSFARINTAIISLKIKNPIPAKTAGTGTITCGATLLDAIYSVHSAYTTIYLPFLTEGTTPASILEKHCFLSVRPQKPIRFYAFCRASTIRDSLRRKGIQPTYSSSSVYLLIRIVAQTNLACQGLSEKKFFCCSAFHFYGKISD